MSIPESPAPETRESDENNYRGYGISKRELEARIADVEAGHGVPHDDVMRCLYSTLGPDELVDRVRALEAENAARWTAQYAWCEYATHLEVCELGSPDLCEYCEELRDRARKADVNVATESEARCVAAFNAFRLESSR